MERDLRKGAAARSFSHPSSMFVRRGQWAPPQEEEEEEEEANESEQKERSERKAVKKYLFLCLVERREFSREKRDANKEVLR